MSSLVPPCQAIPGVERVLTALDIPGKNDIITPFVLNPTGSEIEEVVARDLLYTYVYKLMIFSSLSHMSRL